MATRESDPNQISRIRVFGFHTGKKKKGVTMRIFTASVIIAALSLGTPAFVQAQGAAPSQPEAQTPPDQSSAVIRSIQIVDVKDLKPAVRSKVNDIISQTSDEEMQSLRSSIDATPEAAAALKAKGLNSSHVVAINLADGVLTIFAKTA
jgi:Spy/CpxP family protein refolding chaperone